MRRGAWHAMLSQVHNEEYADLHGNLKIELLTLFFKHFEDFDHGPYAWTDR
jgi:hypothetical protein